jgi:20S proteasome alpha/beta subunit
MHQQLNQQITMALDNALASFNLGVEYLFAGVDESGAHLFSIENPGGSNRVHDVIGYAAVGSGAIHAMQAMIGFGHHPNTAINEAVFRVYAAKRRAEVAPGVGHDTDLAIVTRNGIEYFAQDRLDTLEENYKAFEKSTRQALDELLKDLAVTIPLATSPERTTDDDDSVDVVS